MAARPDRSRALLARSHDNRRRPARAPGRWQGHAGADPRGALGMPTWRPGTCCAPPSSEAPDWARSPALHGCGASWSPTRSPSGCRGAARASPTRPPAPSSTASPGRAPRRPPSTGPRPARRAGGWGPPHRRPGRGPRWRRLSGALDLLGGRPRLPRGDRTRRATPGVCDLDGSPSSSGRTTPRTTIRARLAGQSRGPERGRGALPRRPSVLRIVDGRAAIQEVSPGCVAALATVPG